MSQSAKGNSSQEVWASARRNWPGAAGKDAMSHTASALARAGFADPSLVLRWSSIAGHEVARIAQPVKFQDGAGGAVLTLKCDAGAMVFLQHQTRALIGKVNAYLGSGRVARVKLVAGRLYDLTEPLAHPTSQYEKYRRRDPQEKHNLTYALRRLATLRDQMKR